jgi:hypothetical protein
VRSSWPRVEFKGRPVPVRPRKERICRRGDVVVVNDNLEHYRGELWILLKDLELSDEYNLVGRVPEKEQILLDWIKPRYLYSFIK